MPIVEQETSRRTRSVLALKTLTLAHWGGLARSLAGVAIFIAAGWHEGFSPASALILPLCILIAWLQIALSAILARLGVIFYRYDVLQVTLNWHRQIDLPPLSLSASALQFCLGLITIPAISVLRPGALYQPEIGPPLDGLAFLTAAAAVTTIAALGAWYPHIRIHASQEQQQEAEARA
jgi:hypothetical protein